ncbi:MAG: bifunctional aspartate kinase/homoserine dehydrogenase I [Vicingus serpentipes]|nr:bifunctional aspartate kinase/homoserine dehydrogenase I [Vicingus serpentipes]
MLVMKFGGSSVSSKKNIENIKNILSKKKENYIVVVSALSGTTDQLEKIAKTALKESSLNLIEELKNNHFDLIRELFLPANQTEIIMLVQEKCNELESICESITVLKELSERTQATILSYGEQLSSFIIQKYLQQEGVKVELLDSRELIVANGNYLNASVNFQKTEQNISQQIGTKNYIAGGFIAANEKEETVLLGRGGSDYSGAIYASSTNASALEIWSDVNGIHSANPKIVKNTNSIQELSYQEAFELAYFGAKVLYPPTIQPVMNKNIPLYLKNTLHPEDKGTLISDKNASNDYKIQGVSSLSNISILTVSGLGLARKKGAARKVFQAMEESEANAILITQSCSEQSICIAVNQSDAQNAKREIDSAFYDEIASGLMNPVEISHDQAIVAVVGDKMKQRIGLSGKIFSSLGENGINIKAIAQGASERNISIVVDQKDENKAVHVIHEKFFNDVVKNVHLFIAGVGNVGSAFLEIISKQKDILIKEYNINLKIVGVANSKKMLFNKEGIAVQEISALNKKGEGYKAYKDFLDKIVDLNLRNSVFIDNTASDVVSNGYQYLLENSISVVACNKIACSSAYDNYNKLLQTAKEHNCFFKYETSVGAALPIIKTIHDLRISGDKIHKIEAVISGSLNYIFNEYNGKESFADVVKRAKEEGYTEPNPLIDLSGLDVMRKILILSREAGLVKEMNDINSKSFLPESCTKAKDVPQFFEELKKNEAHFKAIYEKAHQVGNKLKVIASLNNGELSVELKEVQPDSPFYNLEGKDNVVAINTNRYIDEPIVIKGAGAGAEVTASGVFADLMLIVNR